MNYTIGYDIGITSVGWAIKNNETNELVDFGVRKFEEATKAEEARNVRSSRRTLRRKKWRLNQLKRAFTEFGLEDFSQKNTEELIEYKQFKPKQAGVNTIYHLRKKGLTEELTNQELYQVLHNIVKTRGHFYMQHIDFTTNSIKEEDFVRQAKEIISKLVDILDDKLLEDKLKELYQGVLKNPTLKNIGLICNEEVDNKKLIQILKLLKGQKADIMQIINQESIGNKNISDLKKSEEDLDENIEQFVMLYDMLELSKILQEYNYLCEKHVAEIDKFNQISFDNQSDDFKEYQKKYKDITNAKKSKIPTVKNIENNYPNGLYIKEIKAILKKQQEFNELVTEEFINVIEMITSAIIPYWMGPLNNHETTKNNWMVRANNNPVKYSYEYSKKAFDEATSQKEWKELLIGNCTYLHEEKVLPKQSFIVELYNILNEINILTAEKANEEYKLTLTDKNKIINELFLKEKVITFEKVANLLDLTYYGFDQNSTSKRKKFNSSFSAYLQIANIITELQIDDIVLEINNYQKEETSKIKQIENIILDLSLFEDQLGLKNALIQDYEEEKVNKLIKINCKDFSNLSSKFIMKTPLNEEGMSMIDILLSDNNNIDGKNEQQTIITNAVDENGNKINFSANKYLKLLEKHNKLDYQLLVSEGKPLFPVSRTVLRSLNETFKVHNEIIHQMNCEPAKIVIETARDLGDPKKEEPAKHYDTMKKLFEDILKQTNSDTVGNVSEFEELQEYLLKNKRKIELYLRQNGRDMISGDIINLSDLSFYEIDHILPRGFGDDSMDNLMLIHRTTNSKKQNRTAIEYIRQENPKLEKLYIERVNKLREMKLISVEKQKRLLLKDTTEAMGFVQRNLVDTRYIIKEFTSILNAYYTYNQKQVDIVSLQGTYNGIFRRALNFRKSRNLGEQHHAEDAGIIIIVDECLKTLYPGYNKGVKFNSKNQENYEKFLKQINFNVEQEEKKHQINKAILSIRYMYEKAFGENYQEDKFINELKSRTPLLSWREKRKYQGQFFEQTILKQERNKKGKKKKEKKEGPLDVLNVNTNEVIYKGVEFHCIDIYKLTNAKGKKEHYAIHVPKILIDNNGRINETQYLNLITNYYGYHELVDQNNQLKKGAFRIRLYKDQFVYNTDINELVKFSAGTMANKLLEYKLMNIYNYNYINECRVQLIEKLKVDAFNPLDFSKKRFGLNEKNIKTIINFLIENINEKHPTFKEKNMEMEQLISISCVDKVNKKDIKNYGQFIEIINSIYKDISNSEKQFNEIIDYIISLVLATKSKYLVPTIFGRLSKSISSGITTDDAQYCKVITTPLGVRVTYENDKIKLSGFQGGQGRKSYKVIKKEEFNWQV